MSEGGVEAITESTSPSRYWTELRDKLEKEGAGELFGDIEKLKMPEASARVLLRVASRHPEVLLDIGREQPKRADRTPSHSNRNPIKTRVLRVGAITQKEVDVSFK